MNDTVLLLLELFGTFFLIGMFTFGGGYAIMSLIQSEVVAAKGWISEGVFTDIAAISQATPGPIGLNCSTYVGYEVMRSAGASQTLAVLGSVGSSIAIVLPSFLIMLTIVRFYARFHESPLFKTVMGGLRPVVVGMIAAVALTLTVSITLGGGGGVLGVLRENFPDWKSWLIAAVALAVSLWGKQGPVRVLLGGAVLGLLLY